MELDTLRGKKVFVGLSGGVDSAVSAALLQRAGARVTGVYIKGWYPSGMPCTWAADRRDAMRVAARLHIPFITLDASAAYKQGVIDYMLAEYAKGRTPNPDVMCNREVKFGAFYRFAQAQGAEFIATGHYRSGEKDQSYFLWAVPKEALTRTIFPVGHLEKSAVRKLAQKFNLPVADKKDSQGVCFLGNISVDEFLRREFETAPGDAFDTNGERIGTHDGVLLYTIGERVALKEAPPGPWFVHTKDVSANRLVVGHARTPAPGSSATAIHFAQENWVDERELVTSAQYRYRGAHIAGHIEGDRFICHEPLTEILAPGQSLVFYAGGELIGGAIIDA